MAAAPPDEEIEGDDDKTPPNPDEGADQGDGDESDGTGDEADGEESGEGDAKTDDGEDGPSDVDGPDRGTNQRRSANDVIRDQKRTRKEADRRAEAAERKAEEAERKAAEALRRAEEAERRANERRAQESQEEEARRVELMSETERLAHYRQKDKDEHQREMQGVKFQIWDSTDRQEFRALTREDPLVAQVKDQVEAEFARLSSQGRPVSRELLATQFIAKKMRERAGKAKTATRARTEERTRRETVRPQRTRSDVAPERQRRGQEDTAAARRKRLEDVQL
jgi:hypothetical protein